MMSIALWIVGISLLGAIVVSGFCLPYLLSAPLSREKRFYIASLVGMLVAVTFIAIILREYVDTAFAIGVIFFALGISAQMILLRRVDYYLEDLLHELMALVIVAFTMIVLEVFWYWGIDQLLPSIVLRIAAVGIALFSLGLLGVLAKAVYYRWTVLTFLIVVVIKWITIPFWGVWFMIMALLYSVLVGYVAHWQIATTRAQQIYAENTNPAIVWGVLLVVATVLVLFF